MDATRNFSFSLFCCTWHFSFHHPATRIFPQFSPKRILNCRSFLSPRIKNDNMLNLLSSSVTLYSIIKFYRFDILFKLQIINNMLSQFMHYRWYDKLICYSFYVPQFCAVCHFHLWEDKPQPYPCSPWQVLDTFFPYEK